MIRPRHCLAALLAIVPAPASAWTITVSGTIYANQGAPPINSAGVFGMPLQSLVGLPYIETISTNPMQSSIIAGAPPTYSERYGGFPWAGSSAAPFEISVTVGGQTFTLTAPSAFISRSALTSSTGIDAIYQESDFGNCGSAYGFCVMSYIQAASHTPFVPSLDFNQSIYATGLDAGSNTYFLYRNGPLGEGSIEQYTGFYGSIDSIAVNVPEPSTWALMLFGFGLLAFGRRVIPCC